MMKKLISTPIVLVVIIFIISICVYGADRLVVKNDSSTVTFNVTDDGSVYAANKMGIGTATPSRIFEAATTGENAFFVVRRTDGARCGFMAAKNQFFIGTSTSHPVVIAAGNNWVTRFNTDLSLIMGNGATCTTGGCGLITAAETLRKIFEASRLRKHWMP